MRERYTDPASMVEDADRLEAVRSSGLLGSAAEGAFDRLTRLAARITGAPISFFSVVGEDHDFFKSCFGAPEPVATTRRVTGRSFCHFSLLGTEPLVVSDARADDRFRALPSVVGLGVVAYLGIPLHLSNGHALGSFCVVDLVPRDWDGQHIEILTEFASSTLREVELRIARSDERAAKDRIAAQMRDPLTAMHLHADLVEDAGELDEAKRHVRKMREGLERIEASVVRVLGVGGPLPGTDR